MDQFSPFKGDIDDIEVIAAGTPLKQHMRQKDKGRGPAECVPLDASAFKEDQPSQARTSAASNTEEVNTSTCTETMQVPADIVVTPDTIQISEDADTGVTPVRDAQMSADIVVQLDNKGNIFRKDVGPFSICRTLRSCKCCYQKTKIEFKCKMSDIIVTAQVLFPSVTYDINQIRVN